MALDGKLSAVAAGMSGQVLTWTSNGYVWQDLPDRDITVDDYVTSGSANPVKSSGVYAALTGRVQAPATAGTSGQILASDGNGGTSWTTIQVSDPDVLKAATDAEMAALLTSDNSGKVVVFTGASTSTYTQGHYYLIGQGAAGNLVVEDAIYDSRLNGTYVPYNNRSDVWNGSARAYDGTRSGQWFYNAASDVYLVPQYD